MGKTYRSVSDFEQQSKKSDRKIRQKRIKEKQSGGIDQQSEDQYDGKR